ncbi:hypothetical protein HII31_01642 [Pseudocercospora fuligena]|uniref:Uncharacterized protein n=1 Tax=Pseudocercospora fuligena TaxID=685502 RepID=A0A8H6VNW6_9PEZI|nr:hypothetical protein HII31_01642 [Pseudocercospora fuligena]
MRYSGLAIAPFVVAAFAQSESSSTASPTVVPVVESGSTISSTYTYSNTMTNFLSLTNSDGVVTGMPTLSNVPQPAAETSQPAVAVVPAGLPEGITTLGINIGNSTSRTSFAVSVGSSTTVVINGAATGLSVTSGSSAAIATGTATGSDSENTASGTSTESPSSTESSAGETSSAAANSNLKIASGAVLGLGAFFVGLL